MVYQGYLSQFWEPRTWHKLSLLNQEETVVAQQLAEQYGIMTRAGLHCAPLAHETAGTLATGTLRFSFGWQTTPEEITWTIHALQELLI